VTEQQRRLANELASRLQQHFQPLHAHLVKRLRVVHKAALARQVDRVEFDIINPTTLLSMIVCDWGVLGLKPSQAMILDDEELPDADSIPWDKYAAGGIYSWRVVAEELARLVGDLWLEISSGLIQTTITYDGSDLEL
jgi:hypothetical protein